MELDQAIKDAINRFAVLHPNLYLAASDRDGTLVIRTPRHRLQLADEVLIEDIHRLLTELTVITGQKPLLDPF